MVSCSQQSPPPPAPKSQAPPSRTTIRSLGEDLLCEIFLRLSYLPSLVRAALACRAFLAAASSSTAFRRRFVALHPPPLLGLFFDYDGTEMPSFRPVRRSSDPGLAAAARSADVFLSRVPGQDDASPGWQIAECRGGFLLLLNQSTEQIAVYNPLSRALDLFPTPPDEICNGYRGNFIRLDFFLLLSDETPGSFRVVTVCHDKSRLRAAVFSPGAREWQVNGQLYWSHAKQAYQVVLDTATMQFSFVDLPENLKGNGHLYITGGAKDGKPCIVSAAVFTLSIWFRRADADGVEKWMLDSVISLEGELLRATKGSLDDHGDLKVLSILDGIVYLSTFETFRDANIPCWYLFFCLETRKLEKIFHKKDDGHEHP
ncbi:hypothetical protein BAE44_0008734 [Dichanthelium oligosanthes]|uniref:F-box protein AT5G49610-like beta-propeller domain-containing protein n=1 Tax=Dichanthelium oligosanthes TaxID=888268 RepID=A0A1E5VYR9_9POAL|nr:hypothetical protein BAE44_0008734 [Dichanthelium oligosanthes]